jgi:hypothetical protein
VSERLAQSIDNLIRIDPSAGADHVDQRVTFCVSRHRFGPARRALRSSSNASVPIRARTGWHSPCAKIGRIERTLFILDWFELPGLRRQATVELNKGEARNALARAVCFHRLGRLRDRAAEAQQYRASGLALVTAAIALWNTVYLGRALDELRRGGEIVPDPLLAHLAPVGWQHINLTGDYLWDPDGNLGPHGFRSLRTTATNFRPAVAA